MTLTHVLRQILVRSTRLLLIVAAIPLVGCGTPSFLVTPVANTNRLDESTVEPGNASRIAIIEVEGLLSSMRAGGFLQPEENKVSLFTQKLNKAAGDRRVRAVVLRVNSPGGTVTASDTMYAQVIAFRQRTGKPVIAYTQDLAASGGYYVACAADKVVANPNSVVGSIGVIFNTFDLTGTMNWLGVRSDAIKSGAFKDMGSPLRPMTPADREIMQGMVNTFHEKFRTVVSSQRSLSGEGLDRVSDGRVFTGEQALAMGLVDSTGQLADALSLARQLSGASGARAVIYSRPYGYGGSIYASTSAPLPQAQGGPAVLQLQLPESRVTLPTGFYYLWEP